MNNYFKTGLEAWNANMNILPVLNEHKAMQYAFRESIEKKQGNYEQICAVAHAYASNRECSVQEAVYHCQSC